MMRRIHSLLPVFLLVAACASPAPASSPPAPSVNEASTASPTVAASPSVAGPSPSVAGSPSGSSAASSPSPSDSASAVATPSTNLFATPATQPVAGRILFSIEGEGDSRPVYIDQTGLHRIPSDVDSTRAHLRWASADSIVFDSQRTGARHVYRMDLDGSHVTELTGGTSFQEQASVSSDGKTIAYEEYVDATNQDLGLHVANADGSKPRAITPAGPANAKGGASEANISPDGRWIAFARVVDFDGGVGGLSLIHPDGTGLRKLTDDTLGAGYPRWSPDGKRIMFSQFYFGSPGGFRTGPVWVVEIATGKVTTLTDRTDPGLAFEADWSPDGLQVVYKYFLPGAPNVELRLVNADGTNPVLLWKPDPGAYGAESPDWGP